MGPSDRLIYVIGSALVALLLIVGYYNVLAIKDKHHTGQPEAGYTIPNESSDEETAAVKEVPTGAAAAEAQPSPDAAGAADSLETLVAAGDVEKGKKLFRRCGSCHSSKKGDPPALGPNLFGVIGRDIGSQAEFSGYSDAMKAKPGNWTLTTLSEFIASPKKAVPGTAMIYSGIKNEAKRANLLAYIKTLAD